MSSLSNVFSFLAIANTCFLLVHGNAASIDSRPLGTASPKTLYIEQLAPAKLGNIYLNSVEFFNKTPKFSHVPITRIEIGEFNAQIYFLDRDRQSCTISLKSIFAIELIHDMDVEKKSRQRELEIKELLNKAMEEALKNESKLNQINTNSPKLNPIQIPDK